MATRIHIEQARDRMLRYGVHLQGVVASAPFPEAYVYTAGLQRLARPHPEVITFACCTGCGADVLNAAHRHVAEGGALTPGAILDLAGTIVRVEAVLPEWVEAYGCLAPAILDQDEVPMVQLVLPDERGRWPDERGDAPSPLGDQPLLSMDPPWQTAIVRDDEMDLFADPLGVDDRPLLAVPVLSPSGRLGRFELLAVRPTAAGTAVVEDVPYLADHVGVGDVVSVQPLAGLPGCGAAIGQMGALLTDGDRTARAYRLPEVEDVELGDVLWDLHLSGRTRMATTWASLHVSTEVPAELDEAVRPFVRDGLLRPLPLRSGGEPVVPTDLAGCPDCG